MSKEEQKLFLSYSQDEIKIIHKFTHNGRKYCVYYLERGQEGYRVVEEDYIIPEEKTEAYTRKQILEKLKKQHEE